MGVGYTHKTCVLTVMQPVAAAERKPHYIEVNVSEHRTQTSQEESVTKVENRLLVSRGREGRECVLRV